VVSGSWLLEVERSGPCWLGEDWFRSRGLDPAITLEETRISLDGRPVPYLALEGPEGWGLLFYATATPSRYASWTAYRLDVGQGAGEAMTALLPATIARAAVQKTAWSTLWQEEDLRYLPQITAPEPWFWEPVFSQGRITQTVTLVGAESGPITVTLRLWSQNPPVANTPAPQIGWDGELLGAWRWDGPPEQSWPTALPGPDRRDEHVMVVELPAGEDTQISKVWLDGWGVTYRQPLALEGAGVAFEAEGDEAAITGADGARLLDVSDPASPLDLGTIDDARIPTQTGHRYWVGVPWMAPEPARARPLTSVEWASLEQADYLIVAAESYWRVLQPLVEHRQSQGLAVLRLTPEQVYDAFGDGRPDPMAIRSLVRQGYEQGRLRYLLLVGDGSTKPDGYAGQEGARRVVTALVHTSSLHETPSDQALVTNDEGKPLVAVGRFPAQTEAQVRAMVDKTIQWEQNGLVSGLVVNDNQQDFAEFADKITTWLPVSSQRLDAAEDDARSSALGQMQEVGGWLNYVGHGSLTLWGDEKVFQREDQWDQPAVVTVWACLSAYFVHPVEESLAEVWLRSLEGGAVAFVGPTGETFLSQQKPLAETFYQAAKTGASLGDALLAGWQSAEGFQQDAARSFLLLGDPALRLEPVDGGK
jgi:hypothetical protein